MVKIEIKKDVIYVKTPSIEEDHLIDILKSENHFNKE